VRLAAPAKAGPESETTGIVVDWFSVGVHRVDERRDRGGGDVGETMNDLGKAQPAVDVLAFGAGIASADFGDF